MNSEAYRLYRIDGIGKRSIFRMRENWIKHTGADPSGFPAALFAMPDKELKAFCSETFPVESDRPEQEQISRASKIFRLLCAARREDDGTEDSSCRFCYFDDPEFPARLKEIPEPPYGLFVRGHFPEPGRPSCAIVGARMCSAYGKEQAEQFASALSAAGVNIISGMARGIDGIAQHAAVRRGGHSYAVLGCGADVCYPEENRGLYSALQESGGIISEYLPGTPASARLFPQRNRIISGLSDLVLVIEARERSGTLITVDAALEQGREIYALPGRVSDSLSRGANRLIRQGAGIATCPDDILEALFGIAHTAEDSMAGREELALMSLQEPEKTLYEILGEKDQCDLQFLADRYEEIHHRRLTNGDLMKYMMQMLMKELAEEPGIGIFCRKNS
jgi:DNA protecting protein DprA